MLGWCPQPTLIFSWLLLPFCCCFFCWCAPLGTVAASLCCSPSTVLRVLCCVVRAGKEESKRKSKEAKKEAVAEKGRRKQGVPKWKVRMSLLPSSSKQKQRKATDKDTEGRRRGEGKSVVVDKEGGWLRSTLPCRTYTHFSLERERGVVMVAH